MNLLALPALTDNYIWLLHDGTQALVVDPSDAAPVLSALTAHHLRLAAILLTHHHHDHVGGAASLAAQTGAALWGPAHEAMPPGCTGLSERDTLAMLGMNFRVLDVPGHTAGHIAYVSDDALSSPVLFCGDTLFSAGCGRLFEGTPAQMLASLDKLAALPDATLVCCAHEYTSSNLRFAALVEPHNEDVQRHIEQVQMWRAQGRPSLPSTLARERRINPFLRSREPSVMAAAQGFDPEAGDEVAIWAALRRWKNAC